MYQIHRPIQTGSQTLVMDGLIIQIQEVAKMQDGAKKKQEVVQLIQNLEQERKQEQNREIQEGNDNQVQGR